MFSRMLFSWRATGYKGKFVLAALCLVFSNHDSVASRGLDDGFIDHGVCVPSSTPRGVVATQDGTGRDVVLVWMMDHRGCYELLLIDAESGKTEEFPIPVPTGGDAPFASLLSSRNKFYTHFGSRFYEFDPVQRKFTFTHGTAAQMAMGMTEDDNGVIWSVSYPQSGVVSYKPESGEFKDYGHVYKQDWPQYQRTVAADDTGIIYFGVGNTVSQIIALDPANGKATAMLADAERVFGAGSVYRGVNGKVYGNSGGDAGTWMELYKGRRTTLGTQPPVKRKTSITDSQDLLFREFPDGKIIKDFDTVTRSLVIDNPNTNEIKELTFGYGSEGAQVMSMCAGPDGTMCGGSAFPMRFFSYNPKTSAWVRRAAFDQWNTVVRQGNLFYAGGYDGVLQEWDPARPWVNTVMGKVANPNIIAVAAPDINRPHDLLAHPDGKTLVMAGTPGYGLTGGGLMFWDNESRTPVVVKHTRLLPDQAPMALVALPGGKLLVGTTIEPGTGGVTRAKAAELFIMDMASKKVVWHEPVLSGAKSYTDMCMGPNGLVFGFVDHRRFFVFDPKTEKIVMEKNIEAELGPTNSGQQTRTFVSGPDGAIYVLLRMGIAKLNPDTFDIQLLARSPVPVGPGGDYLDGRIYFASGSHMYSWSVPK